MPLLLSKNQFVKDQLVAVATDSVTIYRALYSNKRLLVCQWTEAEKADASILDLRCLTSLWPLAVALSADEPCSTGPFGGIAEYNGP
jgi:hypothetical protein